MTASCVSQIIKVDKDVVLETSESTIVIESMADTQVVVVDDEVVSIVTGEDKATVLTVGIQGPAGPGGNGTSDTYDTRFHEESNTVIYRAEALPGTDDNDSKWRVRKIVISYGDTIGTSTTYPDGDSGFNFAWSHFNTYNYS